MRRDRLQLLTAIRDVQPLFEEGSAEHELRFNQYFVETVLYRDVFENRKDLVLGVKGSGKSAIFRALLAHAAQHAQTHQVVIIPAFQKMDQLFTRLAREWNSRRDDTLRERWRLYILALVGNHLVDDDALTLRDDEETRKSLKSLEGTLDALGLRIHDKNTRTVRRSILTALRGNSYYPTDVAQWDATAADDLEDLQHELSECLRILNLRAWVIFDKLDQEFALEKKEFERVALRGLIQVARDLNVLDMTDGAPSRLMAKLFFRHDLYEKITADAPLPGLEKLRRCKLTWEDGSLGQVVVRRLVAAPGFCEIFDVREDAASSEDSRRAAIDLLFPSPAPSELAGLGGRRYTRSWEWATHVLQDGFGQVVPRTMVEFLSHALRFEEDLLAADTAAEPRVSLLSGRSLLLAYESISTDRLEDYVYAEHTQSKTWGQRLERGPERFGSDAELAMALNFGAQGRSGVNPAYFTALAEMKGLGLIASGGEGTYEVARLYRPALKLRRPKESASAAAEPKASTVRTAGAGKSGARKQTNKPGPYLAPTDLPGPWLRETMVLLRGLRKNKKIRSRGVLLPELDRHLRELTRGRGVTDDLARFATLLAFLVDALDGSEFVVARGTGGHPAVYVRQELPPNVTVEELSGSSRVHNAEAYAEELARGKHKLVIPKDPSNIDRLVEMLRDRRSATLVELEDEGLSDAKQVCLKTDLVVSGSAEHGAADGRLRLGEHWEQAEPGSARVHVFDACAQRLAVRLVNVRLDVLEDMFELDGRTARESA